MMNFWHRVILCQITNLTKTKNSTFYNNFTFQDWVPVFVVVFKRTIHLSERVLCEDRQCTAHLPRSQMSSLAAQKSCAVRQHQQQRRSDNSGWTPHSPPHTQHLLHKGKLPCTQWCRSCCSLLEEGLQGILWKQNKYFASVGASVLLSLLTALKKAELCLSKDVTLLLLYICWPASSDGHFSGPHPLPPLSPVGR